MPLEVVGGKTYFWCAQSQTQPFCDGSHKGTAFTPIKFDAKRDQLSFASGARLTARRHLVMERTQTLKSFDFLLNQ